MKYLVFVFVLFVGCVGLQVNKFNPDAGYSGFGGIKWGTPMADCGDLQYIVSLPNGFGDQYKSLSKKKVSFHGFTVEPFYNFYEGRLSGVALVFVPYDYKKVLDFVKDVYGKYHMIDYSMACFMWDYGNTRIEWYVEHGQVIIAYRSTLQKILKRNKEQLFI